MDDQINWSACRENVLFKLQRFASLRRPGPALIGLYQAVLNRNETFTQYFSDVHLESYDDESILREQIGVPPWEPDPEDPDSANEVILSWVNIVRHGDFEQHEDGSYFCRAQGKIVEINEHLHKAIMMLQSMLPRHCPAWPSSADVDRESEISLSIEADISSEIDYQTKCPYLPHTLPSTNLSLPYKHILTKQADVDRLKQLHLTLEERRHRIQKSRQPTESQVHTKKECTLQKLRSQCSTPDGSYHTISVETLDKCARKSPVSSEVSIGDDIPFNRTTERDGSKSMSLYTYNHSTDESEQNSTGHMEKTPPASTALSQIINQEVIDISDDSSAPPSPTLPTTRGLEDQPNSKSTPLKRSLEEADEENPTRSPSKKQRCEDARSPVNPEFLNHPKEPSASNEEPEPEEPETPPRPRNRIPSQRKDPHTKKRVRNNFTENEKEHAPAWLRAQYAASAGMNNGREIAQAYAKRFGVHRVPSTLKSFLERVDNKDKRTEKQQEKPAETSQRPSKIVKLKVQLPLSLGGNISDDTFHRRQRPGLRPGIRSARNAT
jgi:hypothetical protein